MKIVSGSESAGDRLYPSAASCLLVRVTLTYNNSNADRAHPSSKEVVKKKKSFQSPEFHMEERHDRCQNKRSIGIKKLP